MNNDSTPTDQPSEPEASTSDAPEAPEAVNSVEAARERQYALTPAQRTALYHIKKRFEFVIRLMSQLDILIYAELSILYYMDCSLFRLLVRGINQMMFLTPKPSFAPPSPPHKPYIGAIFAPNLICIILHIFTARSEAGEAMQGYLHGGVIVDIIGQKGPTSKIHLVLLDVLVLVLQCFMLAVHVEEERLFAILTGQVSPPIASSEPRAEVAATQDHDSEERGVVSGVEVGDDATNHGDIELQSLRTTMAQEEPQERNEQHERLLAEPSSLQEDDDEECLANLRSGQGIVADFHILQNLRTQWQDYGTATDSAIQTVGFSAAFAQVSATRRINAASVRMGRAVDALSV